MGSVRLRGVQLVDSLKLLDNPINSTMLPLEMAYRSRVRDSVIIVLKTALKRRFAPVLGALASRGNRLVFDTIDGILPAEIEDFADGYLCSSASEDAHRRQRRQKAALVPHPVDLRIPLHQSDPETPFGIAYMGLRENSLHLDEIPEIKQVDYQESEWEQSKSSFLDAIDNVRKSSHHYIVRGWNSRDGFKPLTKAFVAARLGAVPIASADDAESRLLLGNDYPYLARSSGLDDVLRTIEFARSSYGSSSWESAVRTMTRLRRLSCPISAASATVRALSGMV